MYLRHTIVGKALPEKTFSLAQHIFLSQTVGQYLHVTEVFLLGSIHNHLDGVVKRCLFVAVFTADEWHCNGDNSNPYKYRY